jgi:transposase
MTIKNKRGLHTGICNCFVRVVDAFVDAIDLKSFGFSHVECSEEGRPPYHPSALLKLYLYGYRYGIRTSRKLEREAQTNMEAMWLLTGCGQMKQFICRMLKIVPEFQKTKSVSMASIYHFKKLYLYVN